MLYYPSFRDHLRSLDTHSLHWYSVRDGEEKALFDSLSTLLSPIKATGINNVRAIWTSIPRGPEPSDEELQEAVDYEEADSKEEALKDWLEWNREPEHFYEVAVACPEDGFHLIAVQHRFVLQYCDEDYKWKQEPEYTWALVPFLQTLVDVATQSMERVRKGTYDEWVRRNLPMRHRFGLIVRKDLWKALGYSDKEARDGLSEGEALAFAKAVDGGMASEESIHRLESMSAGLFFKACGIGYRAVGNHEYGVRLSADTDRGLYKRNADMRDGGLLDLPEDDPAAFETWCTSRSYMGDHPWEVCMGGNSTHVSMYPEKDEKGWFFHLAGDFRRMEVVRFHLALTKAGFPVAVYNAQKLKRAVLGEDKVGIVPEGIYPWRCDHYFPGEDMLDFMNLHQEQEDNALFMSKVKFFDPGPLELE